MSIQSVWQITFDFFENTPIVVEPSQGQMSSDAGLLPIRQFAEALDDPRDPELIDHSFLEMVRSRVYGILADYEDPALS